MEVQFGRYQKNILQEWSMVQNLSCVSCAAWNVFPINSLLLSWQKRFHIIHNMHPLDAKITTKLYCIAKTPLSISLSYCFMETLWAPIILVCMFFRLVPMHWRVFIEVWLLGLDGRSSLTNLLVHSVRLKPLFWFRSNIKTQNGWYRN